MSKVLIVAKWLALLPVHGLVVGAAKTLAPIAVKHFSTPDKLDLKFPFRWMRTIDHGLDGDQYTNIAKNGGDALADDARIAWLRKNGGNATNYGLLGVPSDAVWLAKYRSTYNGVITGGPIWWSDNAFCMRWYPKALGRTFEISTGWNLLGPQSGRCKFWCSVRRES
jgi:hypothetical protein